MDVSIINENEVRLLVQDELKRLCDTIRSNHIRAGQKASGRTADSIRMEIQPGNGVVRGIVYGRQAFHTLEDGRAPGRTPSNFVQIIREWMRDKGITAQPIPYIRKPSEKWQPKYTPQERGEMSMAGAIAWTIKTQGTNLYRNGGRADIYTPAVQGTEANIKGRLNAVFEALINTIQLNVGNNRYKE